MKTALATYLILFSCERKSKKLRTLFILKNYFVIITPFAALHFLATLREMYREMNPETQQF
jgi:hypothetical protein